MPLVLIALFCSIIVSLDNAIREFSLAEPLWVVSHCTMLHKYGKRTREF